MMFQAEAPEESKCSKEALDIDWPPHLWRKSQYGKHGCIGGYGCRWLPCLKRLLTHYEGLGVPNNLSCNHRVIEDGRQPSFIGMGKFRTSMVLVGPTYLSVNAVKPTPYTDDADQQRPSIPSEGSRLCLGGVTRNERISIRGRFDS